MSSLASLRAQPGLAWYGATKAALDYLTKAMAIEFAPKVRVNSIAPGAIETELWIANTPDDIRQSILRRPLQKLGKPRDVAVLALYLGSDAYTYMTGQVIGLEGGGSL